MFLSIVFGLGNLITIPIHEATVTPVTVQQQGWTTGSLKTFASSTAIEYGLNVILFMKVITCESHWNPTAISQTGDYGVSQINLHFHPDISQAEAFDPKFSIQWMAQQWLHGNAYYWVCYNELK